VVAERVDEVQLLIGPHDPGEDDGRATLVHADLHHAGGIPAEPAQEVGLGVGVHGAWRDESAADREGAQARVVAQTVRRQTSQRGREESHGGRAG
jgi:hypothetical protein